MYPFEYLKPASVQEAVKAAAAGAYLAGGMTLLPALKMRLARPERLIDLAGLSELVGLRARKESIVVGAMTRHADVAASADVRRMLPALAELAAGIGDAQVRNRGTIGGSIANNDPAADYPAAVLALGATIITDRREISGDSFFSGMYSTTLKPKELVTAVSFPLPRRAAYVKFPSPASRYALVGVMVADHGREVRVAVTGAGPCVFRVAAFEKALAASFSPDAIRNLGLPSEGLNEDLHASREYRASLVNVMARRAVAAALAR
jgi:carbon-monoxide dehydrogenase medium subunit